MDYYFTRNTPLLYLSPQFWSRHNVTVRNVTVAEYCVAGTPLLAWVINMVSSYDTVVINNLMYALHTDGTLVVSLMSMPDYVHCRMGCEQKGFGRSAASPLSPPAPLR